MSDIVDLNNLREMTDGDKELEMELFSEFFNSSEFSISSMELSISDTNNDAFRIAAHTLKGISLNIGANDLGKLCQKAQDSSTEENDIKEALIADIKLEYSKVKQYLQTVH